MHLEDKNFIVVILLLFHCGCLIFFCLGWGHCYYFSFFFWVGLFSFFFRLLEEWVFKSIYLHNDNYFSPFLGRYWLPGVYVSVCLCVCVSVCQFFISIISKSSWPILIKLGRMMYNDKLQVPIEDGINQTGKIHTSSILNIEIAIYYKILVISLFCSEYRVNRVCIEYRIEYFK